MSIDPVDAQILRYVNQTVMKAMATIRTRMRGSDRVRMREAVKDPQTDKDEANLTKAIDREAEELIIAALAKKFSKVPSIHSFVIFSEEIGIAEYQLGTDKALADLVVFIDPVDGTEFIESLQGGWSLVAVYDRKRNEMVAASAGDIYLNRLYWAVRGGDAEAIDFTTHSWFRLDGGPQPKSDLAGARINVLTTKVQRYLDVAHQERLLKALENAGGRINLSWGSNLIIQVAAGYADVGLEFSKGFAAYDILPGLFIAERAGLTLLNLQGQPITSKIDIDRTFNTYKSDPKRPERIPFVVAKRPELAHRVIELLDVPSREVMDG